MRGIPQAVMSGGFRRGALSGLGDWEEYLDFTTQGYEADPVYSVAQASGPSWLDSINSLAGKIGSLVGTVTAADAQRQLIDLNLERAKRGLAPISASAVAPQMNVGIAPDVKNLLVYGALGIGGAMLVSRFLKSRRR